jgi:pentatricopeptide repeat protein
MKNRKRKAAFFLESTMKRTASDANPQRNRNSITNNISDGIARKLCKQSRSNQACYSTYISLLQFCVNMKSLQQGKLVHAHIIRTGFKLNVYMGNTLVNMYAKCHSLEDARRVLNRMPKRNVVSWSVLISSYAKHGHNEQALALYKEMQQAEIKPNEFTFASVLSACASLADIEQGKEVHEEIVRNGFQSDLFVGSALVNMYVKCGIVEYARDVFDKMSERDVVSWNALIAGYVQNGLVDKAFKIFLEMPERNVVSWTAMVAGYVQNGHFDEGLNLFHQMKLAGMKPNEDTFASVLPACANLAALEHGKQVHKDIVMAGYLYDVFVASALVDMYAKCGSIEDACRVFEKMSGQNVVLWTAMILGYAMNGCGKEAIQLFEEMKDYGMNPDQVTFVGVLSACCHAGLVNDGWQYFDCMSRDYNITPVMEHYCCMVDLLGRAGQLKEAEDFICKMPIKPDAAVWGSLLSACRVHTNIEIGERVAEHLCKLIPNNAAPYVQLSNIYAAAGRWECTEKLQNMMRDRQVNRKPGCSWIEVNKQIYTFLVGDKTHPQTQEIYAELERLSGPMKEAGYMPNLKFVSNDVDEEQKEDIVFHHSEKLAIAFALISTTPGTPIRIVKNLRVCGDCHSATKLISKIVGREIVVRDANRFHHFMNGLCSCGDFW